MPTPWVGGVKVPELGKFPIEVGDQGSGLCRGEFKSASVGEDDALVMEAQVNGIGTDPDALGRQASRDGLAQQAQGSQRGLGTPVPGGGKAVLEG